jgi:hypothetical protein
MVRLRILHMSNLSEFKRKLSAIVHDCSGKSGAIAESFRWNDVPYGICSECCPGSSSKVYSTFQ